MYYKCCKIDSHSSATNFGFDKKLKIDFPVCTIYSIRIAICISRTAIYRDAVLVGDTQPYCQRQIPIQNSFTGPDSSTGRASASGSGGRRFDPRPRHTKGVKNGTGSSLADARNKRVVPGRYKKAGKYLLRIFVMSHNSS